ncbi:hypothetical protein [Streptomyces sp. NPDC006134]|uniref:hypothetical protein n=1 Tax=Streptomyces sp. NPDC006134 TaxID=3154467 RepID=UPI0033F3453E
MTCEEIGEVLQGAAGQIDAGRVDKHAKAPGELVILVENPSTRSFLHTRRRGHPPNHSSGWKRLSVENANLETEDLTFINGGILVWLPGGKTHDEEQNLVLMDWPDLQLVPRLTRWLDYMVDQGVTSGPVFRRVLKNGKVATAETRAKTAATRGPHL